MEDAVVHSGADKKHAAGGHDGSAIILGARVLHSQGDQFRILAEGNFPQVLSRLEVDGAQRSPWGIESGITVGVEELAIAGEIVRDIHALIGAARRACLNSKESEQCLKS